MYVLMFFNSFRSHDVIQKKKAKRTKKKDGKLSQAWVDVSFTSMSSQTSTHQRETPRAKAHTPQERTLLSNPRTHVGREDQAYHYN